MTEYTGRTITEAIEKGLQSLNLTRDDVEIEILEEGRGGVFGLGSKQAAVKITPRQSELSKDVAPAKPITKQAPVLSQETVETPVEVADAQVEDSSPVVAPKKVGNNPGKSEEVVLDRAEKTEEERILDICQEFLQSTLDLMGLKTEVEGVYDEEGDDEPKYLLNIEGEDLGILIGRRGETLEAIQYLVRLVVNRHTHSWPRIEVDVEHYKQRRAASLQRLAVTMADRAVNEDRIVVMEAMPARERRLIHLALRDRDDIYTESIGEGENRKVTIIPT